MKYRTHRMSYSRLLITYIFDPTNFANRNFILFAIQCCVIADESDYSDRPWLWLFFEDYLHS